MSKHSHFIIGASLGVGVQPTAIAVVEQKLLTGNRHQAQTVALHLRHLERQPLDATYGWRISDDGDRDA